MFASVQEIAVLHCGETKGNACKLLISNNDQVSAALERQVHYRPEVSCVP